MRKLGLAAVSSLTLLLILGGLMLPAKALAEPTTLWTRIFDGGSSDEGRAVTVDSMNNVIVTGWSIQGTPQTYVTVKYDGNGNEIWNRTYAEGKQARSVAVDSQDNIVVTGFQFDGFTDTFLTIKYDKNGNLLWNKTQGEKWQGEGVAVDSKDNLIVAGYYYPDPDAEQGWDIKIVKMDRNGSLIWDTTYDDLAGEHAFDLAVDSRDNILIIGSSYDGMTHNLIVVKYDEDGNLLWTATYNGGYEDEGHSITVDSMDNVIATGFTSTPANEYFLTIKYDTNGRQDWNRTYRNAVKDEAYGVAVDSKDNVFTVGWSSDGTTADLATVEYDKDGNQVWSESFEGSPKYGSLVDLKGYGVAVDSMGNIILTGGIYTIIPQKLPDFFTMKLGTELVPTVVTHDIAVDDTVFQVITESNSTITGFQFIKEDKKLQFNVTGPTSTHGFCNITIPDQLLGKPYTATLDGQALSTLPIFDNSTHIGLGFTYLNSEHRIEIIGTTAIPELPSTMLLPLLTLTTLFGAAFLIKSKRKAPT